jgi:catechol 2,3-dioxygenase-like lactoylglutathione lyase family enzyme
VATRKKAAGAKGERSTKPQPRGKAKAKARVPAARSGTALTFNHAMLYVADVARSVEFYRDALGFRVVDDYPGAYARLVAPAGGSTIALHTVEPGRAVVPATEGVRLYFEVQALDTLCAHLADRGVVFTQLPTDMPWGWRHAYLADPDGHELSLYRAGAARLRRTRIVSAGDA